MIDRAAIARWNERNRRARVIYDHLPIAHAHGATRTPCHHCSAPTKRRSGLCEDCEERT